MDACAMSAEMNHHEIHHTAKPIAETDALIVAADAGMSVDSGLPEFHRSRSIWMALASPDATKDDLHEQLQGRCFAVNPRKAWEFYGHAFDVC